MNGYAGKILRLDLTNRKVITIPTSDYEQWGGGHGMGSAIFFDLVKDKTIDGFDPENVVTLMTSPFCGTIVPAAGGRTEVQGIGVQSTPIGWYTRSGFGGRFSAMLKWAGWDGVAIQGKADLPVWIDIRDGDVQIRDCADLSLWGMDTRECQKTIWDHVAGNGAYGDWIEPGGKDGGQTTQRPAVVAIGPAGENMSRMGSLIHDSGNGAGQGGFGGVLGSKNLKAVSAIGTGGVHVHDPKALMKTRLWLMEDYTFGPNEGGGGKVFEARPYPIPIFRKGSPQVRHRPQACVACHGGCRGRYDDGLGNEIMCVNSTFYDDANTLDIQRAACDLTNKYGLNSFEIGSVLGYVKHLHSAGDTGPGTELDCPLDFDDYGSLEFADHFLSMVSHRNDGRGNPSRFGYDLAEGLLRTAKKWGKHEKAYEGSFPFWGLPMHSDPRTFLDWGYGSVLGDRDINEHAFFETASWVFAATPEEIAQIYTDKMEPYEGDLLMFDYSDENMYSDHMVKQVSWLRYYARFYTHSLLFCDCKWPDLVNASREDKTGSTGKSEPMLIKAVTGKDISFAEGVELGKKIWNLDHAIWTLQGRHRDMVHFTDNMYTENGAHGPVIGLKDGKWERLKVSRHLDRDRFEDFKTRFYKMQGWDTASGFPTRTTLAGMGMSNVADELEAHGKLGA